MLIISSIYILSLLILLIGFLRFLKSPGHSDNLKISIITAVKNEAASMRDFISSVIKVNYPVENYELIIVDDNSADDTYIVTSGLVRGKNNLKIIRTLEEKSLPGKRTALFKGMEQAAFPFIVITDADCIVSTEWLQCFSAAFEKGYEFVFGPSPFFQKKNLINRISCMENLKNQFLSLSLASLGLPYSAAARNMGFSKEAFFRISGYNNTQDTLGGDDDLLLREALRYKLKIKAFYDKNAFVYSQTKNTLKEYLNQKARHTQTSFHYLFRNKMVLGFWHLLNLFMLFSPPLIFLDFNFIWLFIIKMATDIIILLTIQKKFEYNFNVFEISFLNILYELFIIINFFNAIFKKSEWK